MENIFDVLNNTNFSYQESIETMYRNVLESIYDSSYAESKKYLLILIAILLICSIIGSIANIFVLCIFKFVFDNKKLIREVQAEPKTVYKSNQSKENISMIYGKLNSRRNQLFFNSKIKEFYALIRYLAIIDLYTCSIAVPVTVYEIWNNMKISEFSCKLFELMRAIGVITSNFVIILISIERFNALYKPNNYKKDLLKIRIILSMVISTLIGIICMLQVSVYQKTNDSMVVFIGICLKSEYTFKKKDTEIINISVTSIFLVGCLFVSIIYILIFKKTFSIQKLRTSREENQLRLITKAFIQTHSEGDGQNKSSLNADNLETKLNIFENKKINSCLCFSVNLNMRIAISILMITFLYYISIIPWYLTINGIINYNPYIHYTFLLNNTINPFIYGLLNSNFRSCGFYLLKLAFNLAKNKL